MKYCLNKGYGAGGYVPPGVERVSATLSTPDGKFLESSNRPSDLVENIFFDRHNDVIPTYPSNYKQVVYSYWDHMIQLLVNLMEISALSLNLPRDFFAPYFKNPGCVLRLSYYPPQVTPTLPNQLRYGEHTDYTGFTILRQDPLRSGLQVKLPDGTWVECDRVPGSFTVNAGDLIQVWTNDRFVSNLHRVVNPSESERMKERISIVFFTGPSDDTVVSCLPTCMGPDNPPKYEAVRCGDHLNRKRNISSTKNN